MTKLLDKAFEAAHTLPPAAQDDIARLVLRLAGGAADESPMVLSTDECAAIDASKAAAVSGDFATEDQVRATWARHGVKEF